MSTQVQLTPFNPADAPTVSAWATSERDGWAWCSRTEMPVPPDVIVDWGQAPDVEAFALAVDGQMIGYGELWIDDAEAEVELARLIIEPGRRGSGWGRRMVTELVTLAQRHHQSVIIRLHPDNLAAKRCYAAAGFAPVTDSEEAEWNAGQPIDYSWMTFRGR